MIKIKDLMKSHGLEFRNKPQPRDNFVYGWKAYVTDRIGENYYITPKQEHDIAQRLLNGETLTFNFWGIKGAEDEIRLKSS